MYIVSTPYGMATPLTDSFSERFANRLDFLVIGHRPNEDSLFSPHSSKLMAWNDAQRTGCYTLEKLNRLPDDNRKATLRQYLVQTDPVIIHPFTELEALNSDISSGLLLLQESTERTDDLGTLLGTESKKIFYGENEFLVWWDGLREFMHPPESRDSEIGGMVRRIVVRYDMRQMCDKRRHLASELELLFELARAERVTIEILGSGTAEGSDFATQAVIQGMSTIVRDLILYFGDRFSIRKALGGWILLNSVRSSNLRRTGTLLQNQQGRE